MIGSSTFDIELKGNWYNISCDYIYTEDTGSYEVSEYFEVNEVPLICLNGNTVSKTALNILMNKYGDEIISIIEENK